MAHIEDLATYTWIRKLLALLFLPHTEIIINFDRLCLRTEDGPCRELVDYIASQWIYDATFLVKDWSVFM